MSTDRTEQLNDGRTGRLYFLVSTTRWLPICIYTTLFTLDSGLISLRNLERLFEKRRRLIERRGCWKLAAKRKKQEKKNGEKKRKRKEKAGREQDETLVVYQYYRRSLLKIASVLWYRAGRNGRHHHQDPRNCQSYLQRINASWKLLSSRSPFSSLSLHEFLPSFERLSLSVSSHNLSQTNELFPNNSIAFRSTVYIIFIRIIFQAVTVGRWTNSQCWIQRS